MTVLSLCVCLEPHKIWPIKNLLCGRSPCWPQGFRSGGLITITPDGSAPGTMAADLTLVVSAGWTGQAHTGYTHNAYGLLSLPDNTKGQFII